MKYNKAVYVTINDIKSNLNRNYEVYTSKVAKTDKDYLETNSEISKDFSCQYDSKGNTVICTCKRTKRRESRYYNISRQVYRSQRYSSARGFTDVGVGSVKTVLKKRVKRIYLPDKIDRGVGSSELAPFIQRTRDWTTSYYDQKKTSSKCVGGVMEYKNTSVLSEKLSTIYQTKSGSTSPKGNSIEKNENSVNKSMILQVPSANLDTCKQNIQSNDKTDKQKEINSILPPDTPRYLMQIEKTNELSLPTTNNKKSLIKTSLNDEKYFSSDSLVQHVHNLENPSSYKHSKTSIDLIENKLEREYRRIFTTKSKECKPSAEVKPIQDFKSASLLRRRFEALRRGLKKKEDSKNDCVVIKTSSQTSVRSKRDVSIASDPPSLEARSYTNVKINSPNPSPIHQYKNSPQNSYRKPATSKKDSSRWSTDVVDSDYQNAKGMFKLWGKKFNLEEDSYKKSMTKISSDIPKKQKKKVELILPKDDIVKKEKKEGKRFSFFKKKSKDNSKQPYKSKKGVTAGRCEVGDGFMIKIGAANDFSPELPEYHGTNKSEKSPDEYDAILRKAWLKKYLANKMDSRSSVQIRWNNDMYATSSSTVFELMECVYKNTGIIFRSKSEVTTGESSYYHSQMNPQVNFMRQSIEAWMIPKMILDNKNEKSVNLLNKNKERKKNIQVTFSNQKWFIDKSKAFSQKLEVFLHSKNFGKNKDAESSEYIMIDIPKGYFLESSSDDEACNHTSDEEVYNIVEYETANSSSYLKRKRKDRKMDIGDHEPNDIHVTVSVIDSENNEAKILETVIKSPPLHRDVVVQGSNVYIPKRCDVIGVGIITQRDIRDMKDIKKPILKMQEEITDDESKHTIPPQKKCELAESYLQDYYRHWTPLGIDLFSWCVSDSHLRGSSDNNSFNSLNNQGDGSKSCPNIYDDFQACTIVSSCATSSCSHCIDKEERKIDDMKTTNFLNKLKKKPDPSPTPADGKRFLPKDSLEVFKRRKIYAASNKSNWGVNCDRSEPYSVPSIQDKGAQNTLSECPKAKPCCKAPEKPKKSCKKHVSLQDCETMSNILQEQLSDKLVEGILTFKSSTGCDNCKKKVPECVKHARVIPTPMCEIPQPPCMESCIKEKKPPCTKKSSSSCNVPPPPKCPAGPTSPCQLKPCPPTPPPCALVQPCQRTPPRSPPVLCSRPCPPPQAKPIPPRLHSPPQIFSPRPSTPCACRINKSPCSLPQCPTANKPPPCNCTHSNAHSADRLPLCKQSSSLEFPWPLKNQNSPSPKLSGISLKNAPNTNKGKDCKPDCANRPKVVKPSCPPPPCQIQPKVTGLFLKKMPMPQKPSNECMSESIQDGGVIRLNSREKICIKMKQQTPSTEEIREGCNIKVQDEDGQTLYERRDYRRATDRANLLKDMYRNSQIHRVSTSKTDMVTHEKKFESCESKSNTSLSNIVEINFNLTFKQNDKTAEVNIKKCGDSSRDVTKDTENTQHVSSKEVYVLQDKERQSIADTNKGDVNIKIVIKSYQQNPSRSRRSTKISLDNDEYCKKISEKFHTVSTGYSDVLEKQTYSMHTTLKISTSVDKNETANKPSEELINEELAGQEISNLTDTESVTKQSAFECSVNLVATSNTENEDNKLLPSDISQIKLSKTNIENTQKLHCEKQPTCVSTTDNDEALFSDVQPSKVKFHKINNKEEKKEILKQIFESSDDPKKKTNNKQSKMRGIRQMLRAVLTSDSSAYDDTTVDHNLAKELTYASLKPNYFKDSDSMTNYYQHGSSVSIRKPSDDNLDQILYPTEQTNSEYSYSGDSTKSNNPKCLCSHFAAKLNLHETNNLKACCCRGINKKDEEVSCDLNKDDVLSLPKTVLVDAETQDSKCVTNKSKTSVVTEPSNKNIDQIKKVINETKSKYLNKAFKKMFSYSSSSKAVPMKNINRQTVLGLSEDEKVIVLNTNFDDVQSKQRYTNRKIKPLDILQLHETKKAVLEIYAEKSVSAEDEHMVAKLPKFIYNKESEILNYQETIAGFRHVSRRNIVMMSITR